MSQETPAYSYDGPAAGLRLTHLATNGMPCAVRISGVEFQIRVLDGMDKFKRSFLARAMPVTNDLEWTWRRCNIAELRDQLNIAARRSEQYLDKRKLRFANQQIRRKYAKSNHALPKGRIPGDQEGDLSDLRENRHAQQWREVHVDHQPPQHEQ